MRRIIVLTCILGTTINPINAQEKPLSNSSAAEKRLVDSEALLVRAYQREFAFLEAEREALRKRLTELDRRMSGKVERARTTVSDIQSRITDQELLISELQNKLDDIDVQAEADETPKSVAEHLINRAASALKQVGHEVSALPADSHYLDKMKKHLRAFESALGKGGQLRAEHGRFFDPSGALIEGELLRLGYVAAYGYSDEFNGMLRPVGQGRFQIVEEPRGRETALALRGQSQPESLTVFLYENIEKEIELPERKTILSIVEAGGVIAYVIVCLGLIAAFLLAVRSGLLITYYVQSRRVKRALEQALTSTLTSSSFASTVGPHGRVLAAMQSGVGQSRSVQMDIFTENFLKESPRLDRFSSLILVLAAIAPLLGLLGTVTGMIATFDTITQFGTGNPKLLSGGISEALITTELGLVVAIPAVLFGNLLRGWSDGMKDQIEMLALALMNHCQGQRESVEFRTQQPSPPRAQSTAKLMAS